MFWDGDVALLNWDSQFFLTQILEIIVQLHRVPDYSVMRIVTCIWKQITDIPNCHEKELISSFKPEFWL